MNNSTKKTFIILGSVIVILAAALLCLKLALPQKEDSTDKGYTIDYLVEGLSKETVSSVTIYKEGVKDFRIYYDVLLEQFLLEGYESNIYEDNFATFFAALSNMIIDDTVEEPLSDDEYGLAGDMSRARIEIVKKDGTVHNVYVGDLLLSGTAYYCKADGDENVYAVRNTLSNVVCDKKTFISKIAALPFDESTYYYTDNVKIYKNNTPFLHITLVPEAEREEGNVYTLYRMEYPAQYVPNDYNYGSLLKALATPTVDEIVTLDVTYGDFAKYGFDVPSFDIEYTAHDGMVRRLVFGNKTADGRVYMLSLDYGFVGLVDAKAKYPFLDWQLIEYVNNVLIGYNIDAVAKIAISSKSLTSEYNLSGTGSELTVDCDGEFVDTYNFRQLYRVLLMTNLSGYADVRSRDNRLLTVTLTLKSGAVREYAFYGTTTRRCYFTLNGDGEFYVSLDDVENIIKAHEKLSVGERIDADTKYQ